MTDCKSMKNLILVTILLICGCTTVPKSDVIPKPDATLWKSSPHDPAKGAYWTPNDVEKLQGEQLGRWYASQKLGVSNFQLAKLKAQYTGWFRDGKTILWIQFYDPAVFKPLSSGGVEAVAGGFPSYFTISIDTAKWLVVGDYSCSE